LKVRLDAMTLDISEHSETKPSQHLTFIMTGDRRPRLLLRNEPGPKIPFNCLIARRDRRTVLTLITPHFEVQWSAWSANIIYRCCCRIASVLEDDRNITPFFWQVPINMRFVVCIGWINDIHCLRSSLLLACHRLPIIAEVYGLVSVWYWEVHDVPYMRLFGSCTK
jgi:hypothetical protein